MTDILESLEIEYLERLAQRSAEWQVKHPDEAKLLREQVTATFRRPGKPDPEPGSLAWEMVEQAVNEAVRARKGWPTARAFIALQGGDELPTPPRPAPRPLVTVPDRKRIAAGDA
jgi:hypothetical protein